MRFIFAVLIVAGISVHASAQEASFDGRSAEELDALILRLGDPDEDARYAAIRVLASIGKPAARALTEALKSELGRVRAGAAEALGMLDHLPVPAVLALIDAAEDEDAAVRRVIAHAMGWSCRKAIASTRVLADLLDDEDAVVRREAAKALARHGAKAASAEKVLIATLTDPEADVRAAAAYALGGMAEYVPAAIPGLVTAMADATPEVRSSAVYALRAFAELPEDAILAIGRAANDPDERVRVSAAWTLMYLGPRGRLATSDAIRSLGTEYPSPAWCLRDFFRSSAAHSIHAMLTTLKDPDEMTRLGAIRGLRLMGRVPVADAVGRVLADDPSTLVRLTAAQYMRELGDRVGSAVPYLFSGLADDDAAVRYASARALAAVGEDAALFVVYFVVRAREEDRMVLWSILGAMDEGVKLPRGFLLDRFWAGDAIDRRGAAENLFRLEGGVDFGPIRRRLEEDPAVLIRNFRALYRLRENPGAVLPVYIAALAAKDPEIREAAVAGLHDVDGRLGEWARRFVDPHGRAPMPPVGTPDPDHIPLLGWASRHALPSRRWEAVRELARYGEAVEPALPDLRSALGSSCDRTREWAARALALAGSDDPAVVEALTAALEDDDPSVRADAALALHRAGVGAEAESTAPLDTLRNLLATGDASARWHAVRALREIGAGASGVEAALRQALTDEDEIVRLAARSALRAIDSGNDR